MGGNSSGEKDKGKSVGVGASFGIAIANMTVDAGIGQYRTVNAGGLNIEALARNDLQTITVSGADPLAIHREVSTGTGGTSGTGTLPPGEPQDIAVDASVAVSFIKNYVKLHVDTNTIVTLIGGNIVPVMLPFKGALPHGDVNLNMLALQTGHTLTQASGFAVGGQTAVGAAVAVNIADSLVDALYDGNAIIRELSAGFGESSYSEVLSGHLDVATGYI